MVSGEVVLVTNAGEQVLRAGECAAFPAGVANGHCLQNRSDAEAVVLEVGSRKPDEDGTTYPDVDMALPEGASEFTHKDGTPYVETKSARSP